MESINNKHIVNEWSSPPYTGDIPRPPRLKTPPNEYGNTGHNAKYYDYYVQDEAKDIYIDKYGSEKGHKLWEGIQHSILGRIKSKLKESKQVYTISQWEPTTQTCFKCGFKQKLTLNDRVYYCPNCGYENDRDINAALNILNTVHTEHREVKA